MEKMIWTRPEMNEFAFAANEYVAACGDGGTTYKFTCDAGIEYIQHDEVYHDPIVIGGHEIIPGWTEPAWTEKVRPSYDVYRDDDGEFGELIGSGYRPCDASHEVTVGKDESFGDIFFKGWMDKRSTSIIEKMAVMIWRGKSGNNCHCTENLDVSTWEIAKS